MKKSTKKMLISSALVMGLLASQVSAATYTVKKGDTLYGIGKKTGTSVTDIKKWNNLKSDNLTIGKVLQINTQPTAPTPPTSGVNPYDTYTVKKGDTYYSISKKYNVSIENLKKWNALGNTLPIGKVMIVKEQKQKVNYTVQKGDTLYAISKRVGVSLSNLQKWNPGVTTLKIGQVIVIGSVTTPPTVVGQTPAEKEQIKNTVAYETVALGATFESIAAKHNLTVAQLKAMNPNRKVLYAGDVLAVSKSKLVNPVFGANDSTEEEKELKVLYVKVSDDGVNVKSAGNGVIVAAGEIVNEEEEVEGYYTVVRYTLPTGSVDVEYYDIDELLETTVVGKTLATGETFGTSSQWIALRVSVGGSETLLDPTTFFNY